MSDELVRSLAASVVVAAALEGVPSAPLPEQFDEHLDSLERRAAESDSNEPLLDAPTLRAWARAVVAEANAEQMVASLGDGLGSRNAYDRLCRLLPLQVSIRVLRRAGVPRDLLTVARAAEFAVAAHALGAALDDFHQARMMLPTRRLKASAYRLDLQTEISQLRNDGSWLPWDNGTAPSALRRVRPHFRSGYESRSRDELVSDLRHLQTFVAAKTGLEQTARTHGDALGKFYGGPDAPWTGGLVARHLQLALEGSASAGISAADLDAVWSLPASQVSTKSFWSDVAALAAAREARATSDAQVMVPSLVRFAPSLLYPLSRRLRRAWSDEVPRYARVLSLLVRDETERQRVRDALAVGASTRGAGDGGARIQEGFRRAREREQGSDDLAEALSAAVKASQVAFSSLETELRDVLDRARPEDAQARVSWDEEVSHVNSALRRRAEALGSFRVVLFGRTGAGKSSFVEALTRGDGQSISTGDLDFTTVARPVRWGACTLIDTPGIEGWGREDNSAELEREARDALDSADLVVLAFDSSNQKVGEFDKVARWVLEYDKPTIAVLNVRNSQWRRPDKEPDLEVRRGHSLSVREHAQHVADALAAFGLVDTLPLAIQTFNAVAARCPDYEGPRKSSVRALREQVGPDALEEFSHFSVVETLLTAALNQSALELRLQSLSNDTRRRLCDLAQALLSRAEESRSVARAAEYRLDAVLTVIGAGAGSEQQQLDRQWRRGTALGTPDGQDLLSTLEEARQQPFATETLYGRVWDAWDDHCVLHLDVAALRAGTALEASVRDAFASGDRLSTADIQRLYEEAGATLAAAADAALQATLADLNRELDAVSQKLEAESLSAATEASKGLDASRGTGARNASRALTVVSAGLMFVPIPGVNLLIAAGARAVGQILLSLFSKRSRAAGEKARADELLQALISARNATAGMRDELALKAVRQVGAWVSEVAPTLRGDLQQALAQRETATQCEAASAALAQLVAAMPFEGAGSEALVAAREHVASQQLGEWPGRTWSSIALGEEWLDDVSDGAARPRPSRPDPLPSALTSPYRALTISLRDLPHPRPREVSAYLASLRELPADLQARLPLTTRENTLTLALTGPERVGVTAIVDALTAHIGRTTGTVRVLDATGPTSDASLASADVVALVVPPSLFGAAEDLDHYLGPPCLLEDTHQRLVLVLTRIDELAADPDEDPDQLADAVQRKLAEVARFSQRNGLPPGRPVVPLAGAPFGQPCPDDPPWWSGTDRLADALCSTSGRSLAGAGQVRRLVGALDQVLIQSTEELQTRVLPELARAEALVAASSRGTSRGEQLAAQMHAELSRALERVVMPRAYDLAGAANKEELRKAQERLDGWRNSAEASQALQAFEAVMVPRLQEWLDGLGRMLEWQPPARPAQADGAGTTGGHSRLRSDAATAATIGVKAAIRTAKQLGSHDEYYKLAKDLGRNLKPWEAVKGAQRFRNVSPALSGLGGVLAALELWNSEKAEKARNKLRHDAPGVARAELNDFVTTYLQGTPDEPGVSHFVATALDALSTQREEAAAAVEAASAEQAALEERHSTAAAARDSGIALLTRKQVDPS